MTRSFRFKANDTLMFRDGAPFNQADDGASAAESVFPPNSTTLIGALRLALAQKMGFPKRKWPSDDLGDGVDWQAENPVLGPLSFGPLNLHMETESETLTLFPCPLSVVNAITQGEATTALLAPSDEVLETDMGAIRLPSVSTALLGSKVKQPDQSFVDRDDLIRILCGVAPRKLFTSSELWARESHTGIGIEETSRHTRDGELYFASYVRLNDGVSIGLSVEGLQHDHIGDFTQSVGGEHRMMHVSEDCLDMASVPASIRKELKGTPVGRRYCAIALSPIFLGDQVVPDCDLHPDFEGKLVSACVGPATWAGGWDSRMKRPLPMVQMLPAGTVLFFEATSEPPQFDIGAIVKIGNATEWGLGHMIIGNWRSGT